MPSQTAHEPRSKQVLISTGEASGDLHAAHLVKALKRLDPAIVFHGIGGKHMRDAGVEILVSADQMAVVGLTEIWAKLPGIVSAYYQLKAFLKKSRPDLLILVDYPGFNLRLARAAHRLGIPVLYYITPQVWAWRRGRVKKLGQWTDRLAVILPFEEAFFRKQGLEAQFVGHPLLDVLPPAREKTEARRQLGLSSGDPVIGLLPGSRQAEITNLLPVMLQALNLLVPQYPRMQGVLALAPSIPRDLILENTKGVALPITIVEADTCRALSVCDLAFVTSGTATLETALMAVPMVILYRMSRLSYWVARAVIRVPYIGLANLVAQERIAPELIQREANPERLARETRKILDDPQVRQNMIQKLEQVRRQFGQPGCAEKTARIVLEMLGRSG